MCWGVLVAGARGRLVTVCSANTKSASRMAKLGVGASLTKAIMLFRSSKSEMIMPNLLTCITHLAPYDRTIADSFHSMGCVPFCTNQLKDKLRFAKKLNPFLHGLSLLASNENVAKSAGKAGAIDIALGLVMSNVTQIRTHATLRLALKLLAALVASPSNIARFVNRQGALKVLTALTEWIKVDVRNRCAHTRARARLCVCVCVCVCCSPRTRVM